MMISAVMRAAIDAQIVQRASVGRRGRGGQRATHRLAGGCGGVRVDRELVGVAEALIEVAARARGRRSIGAVMVRLC